MVLPIELRDKLPLGLGSNRIMLILLQSWYEQFDKDEKRTINQFSGYSLALLDFPIPEGFLNAFLSFWDHHRHVCRLGDQELMPSLEEFAYLSGFELAKPCVQVTSGDMLDPFLSTLGLKRNVIRPYLDEGHVLPVQFLHDRFSSIQGFHQHVKEFQLTMDLEQWGKARLDAFLICLLSRVYFPVGLIQIDIGLAQVITEIKKGRTVVLLILTETRQALSYCRAHSGAFFRGSCALLYIWIMGHLTPRPSSRALNPCFKKDVSASYRVRPRFCSNKEAWEMFFALATVGDIIWYTGWSSRSFLSKVPHLGFIPLIGLRGMMSYFPSVIASQFGRFQDIPIVTGGEAFCGKITMQQKKLVDMAYRLWDDRITSLQSPDEPREPFSSDYLLWVENQRQVWEAYAESDQTNHLPNHTSAESHLTGVYQQNASLVTRVDELQNQLSAVIAEHDRAISIIKALQDNVNTVATQLRDQAPPGVDNSVLLNILAWVHQNLNF